MLPRVEVDSPAQIGALLARASIETEGDIEVSADQQRALIEHAAEMIYYRFIVRDCDAYQRWRQDRGYELLPRETLLASPNFIADDYVAQWGDPRSGGEPTANNIEKVAELTAPDLFRAFFDAGLDRFGGSCDPVALCQDRAGLAIVLGVIRPTALRRYPHVHGEWPAELWQGGRAATFRNWWTPSHATERMFDRTEVVPCAVVGVIFAFRDGSRAPILQGYVWDQGSAAWTLAWMGVNNTLSRDLSAVEY